MSKRGQDPAGPGRPDDGRPDGPLQRLHDPPADRPTGPATGAEEIIRSLAAGTYAGEAERERDGATPPYVVRMRALRPRVHFLSTKTRIEGGTLRLDRRALQQHDQDRRGRPRSPPSSTTPRTCSWRRGPPMRTCPTWPLARGPVPIRRLAAGRVSPRGLHGQRHADDAPHRAPDAHDDHQRR